jgi:hypothetical protein
MSALDLEKTLRCRGTKSPPAASDVGKPPNSREDGLDPPSCGEEVVKRRGDGLPLEAPTNFERGGAPMLAGAGWKRFPEQGV